MDLRVIRLAPCERAYGHELRSCHSGHIETFVSDQNTPIPQLVIAL